MRDQTHRDQIVMKKHLQRAKIMSTLEKLYHDALELELKLEEKTYEQCRVKELKKQEYWTRKVKMQENEQDRETYLIEALEGKTAKHIKKRQKKWDLELIKMRTQLEEIKYIMSHPRLRRELEEKKAKLAKAIETKKKEEKKKSKEKEKENDEDKDSEDSKEMKFSKNVPPPVQVAIIHLLSNVLHNYVLKLLIKAIRELPELIIETQTKLVHQYYNQMNKPFRWVCGKTGKRWPRCKHVCITEIEEEQEEPALMPATRESNSMTTIESSEQKKAIQAKIAHYDMERKKLRVNGGSIHSTQTLNKTKQSRMNTSSVSFGVQSLIGLREVTDPSQLRNCKKRIPTPVPSDLQLVDSLAVECDDNDDDIMMFDESIDMRILINLEVNKFRKWVGKQILLRVKKAIDDNSRIMYKYELRDVTSRDVLDKLADRFLVSTCAIIIETSQADQLCDVLVRELFIKLNKMRSEDLKKRKALSNKKNSSVVTFQFVDSEDEYEEADGEFVVPEKQVRIKFFDEEAKQQAMDKSELIRALSKLRSGKETEVDGDEEDDEEDIDDAEEEEDTDRNDSENNSDSL